MALTPEELQATRDELLKRYTDASNDTTGIQTARDDADRANTASTWGTIANQLASIPTTSRGGKANSNAVFDMIKAQGQDRLKRAESDRSNALSGIRDQASMQQQMLDANRGDVDAANKQKEFANSQTKFGQEQTGYAQSQADLKASMDPNSPQSLSMQAAVKNIDPTFDASGKSAHELQSVLSALESGAKMGISREELAAKQAEAAKPKPLTEGQGKAQSFFTRAADASATLDNLEKQGVTGISPEGFKGLNQVEATNNFLDSKPLGIPVGSFVEMTGLTRRGSTSDVLKPKEQEYLRAQQQWENAILRDDTGATIGEHEKADLRPQIFPIPGDSPEVIQQKKAARKVYEDAIAGKMQDPAFAEVYRQSTHESHPEPKPLSPKVEMPGADLGKLIGTKYEAQFRDASPQQAATLHFTLMGRDPEYQKLMSTQN